MKIKFTACLLLLIQFVLTAQKQVPQPGTYDFIKNNTQLPAQPKLPNNAEINNGNGFIATSYTLTKCGLNYAAAANPLYKRGFSFQVGLNQPAAFNITGIPACVTIEKAFLYSCMSGNGIAVTATVTNPQAVTASFPMTIIGQHIDKCWGYQGSYAYRADVTSIINGNGNYMISGLPTNPPTAGNDTDGAVLIIIFSDESQSYTGSIVIADGCQTASPGTVSSTITAFNVCAAPTSYTNFMAVSDFQKIANQNISLNSTTSNYVLTTTAQQVFNFITEPGNAPVANQTSAIYGAQSTGDCYSMIMAGMYYRTNCLTCTPTTNTLCLLNPPNSSTVICPGNGAAVSITNPNNFSNPSYSIQPGGQVQTSPNFNVNPSVTTNYTLYVTGTTSTSAVITQTSVATVSVLPGPVLNPNIIQPSCNTPTNSANLNVTFSPSGSPNYTVNWQPLPSNFTPVNSGTATGLASGLNTVTVTTSDGCSTTASFTVAPTPLQASFAIVNPANNYTISCNNPNVLLTNSVTNGVPLTYTWFPTCASTVVASSYNFTQQCTGQVVGSSSTGCLFTQTFSVFQDFTSPTIAITPTVQNITCLAGAACFTLTSNMGPNVTTNWYQVSGTNTVYVGVPQGTLNIFCPTSAGIFWGESVNNLNGCRATRSVVVTASTGVPQFTVTSPTNFTVGCASTSITAIQVTFVQTDPANQPVNYAFVPPPGTATPVFTNNPNLNNITVPGTYVVYVRDITNNCTVSQSISIIQNTIQPNIDFIQPLSILSCKDPSMVLNGISNNQNVTITWTVPASPSPSVNPTANTTVTIKPSVSGSTSNVTVVGIFTVGATDNNNQCRATKTVQINQDIRLPVFSISALTNSVINCKNSDVLLVPIVSTLIASQLVPTYTWYPPVGNVQPGTSYNTTAPGSHTAISMSSVNGCTTTATYIVASDFAPPAIGPAPDFTLDCNANPTVAVVPNFTGTTSGYTYSWTVPPGALTSNLTSSLLVTNVTGYYFVLVTNTLNGCSYIQEYYVGPGAIKADFIATPQQGFAPLAVTFSNTSVTSTGASSIISNWGYGNGIVSGTVMNTQTVTTTYTASGTYSVVLQVQKGSCVDTAMRIIRVELPSSIEVPNIFTPNGDGVNDIFRLRASNLSEVYIIIHDRWGAKVYETTSETGNFAWDGNNLQGAKCADGIYFYIIKAKGADGEEYDLKGHVTLIR
jgi:gliding motility-associated-like protein